MVQPVQILTHEFTPFRGGIGTYVEETARAAVKLGLKSKVWAPAYDGGFEDNFPFEVDRINMRGKHDWVCRLKMARAIKRAFPDGRILGTLVLAEPGPIRLWMYHRFLGLPRAERLVLVLHGSEVRLLTRNRRRRARLGMLLQETDCVGVVSTAVRQNLLSHFPEFEARVVLVAGAVRSSWAGLTADAVPRDSQRREILQVGRLHPRKGQLTLLEAVGLLPESLRAQIKIRLIGPVGSEAYTEAIRGRIRSAGLPVTIEGSLPEEALREAYRASTMVVMPSQAYKTSVEGLGLALLEAQHFGRPVIGSRIGGIPEALQENESGLLVPPGDCQALCSAIATLLTDREPANRMGTTGTSFVRRHFSWEENVRRLVGAI